MSSKPLTPEELANLKKAILEQGKALFHAGMANVGGKPPEKRVDSKQVPQKRGPGAGMSN
jgi:hypothetical protein